jgi:hypothetical protein
MYLLKVQAPVAHQFTGEQQYRDLMAIARFCLNVGIDVEHVDGEGLHLGQSGELAQHLFAKPAPGARVEQEARRRVLGQSSSS